MRILMLAAAFASFAAVAVAQTESAPPPELIPGAGRVDARRHIGKGPPGGDGPASVHVFISPSGEPFRGGDGLATWFAQADLNHDGAITADEFQADALRFFKTLDTNGDGILDGFEIQAYEQQVPEMGQILVDEGRGRGRGGRGRKPPPGGAEQPAPQPSAGRDGAARFSLLNEPEPVLAADLDVSGKVTRAEWLEATARRFAKLDRDKSGRLTLEELRGKPAKK